MKISFFFFFSKAHFIYASVFVIIIGVFCRNVQAQSPKNVDYENVALLWRGFRHSWQYNHRLHRLGDFPQSIKCDQTGCDAIFLHTGSAGAEQDKAEFQSFFSIVFSNSVTFVESSDSLLLLGKEGEICKAEKKIRIPPPQTFTPQERYTVILNGFDLIAIDEAENIQLFSVEVTDAFFTEDSLEFEASAAIQSVCTGKGCQFSNSVTRYLIRFHYIIFFGGNSYTATVAALNRNVYWDTKTAPEPEIPRQFLKGDTVNSYSAGLPAFQKIELRLDRPHWFVALHLALHLERYQQGVLTFRPDLFFFQWEEQMQKKTGRKKSGMLQITAQIVFLQFKEACIKHEEWSGNYSWRQTKALATDESATYGSKFSFPKVCN
jgi:hypothetical protein